MRLVLICIYGFIFCMTVLSVHLIRSRSLLSEKSGEKDKPEDFIMTISNIRRKHLASKPWNMKYETYIAMGTTCSIVFAVFGYLYGGLLAAACAAVIGQLIPELIVNFQFTTQKQKFEERYARSLRQLSSALKSGMTLPQAVEDVCNSPFVHDDVRMEYQRLSADLKLGVPIQEAFEKFAERVQFSDAEDVAVAIAMQTKVGGREGAVVETIARNIGDRMMLRKEIRSMFAGSSVTVTVLDILPFGVVAFLLVGASDFLSIYFSSTGMFLLLVGLLVFMGIGSIVTHRMMAKLQKECGVRK